MKNSSYQDLMVILVFHFDSTPYAQVSYRWWLPLVVTVGGYRWRLPLVVTVGESRFFYFYRWCRWLLP